MVSLGHVLDLIAAHVVGDRRGFALTVSRIASEIEAGGNTTAAFRVRAALAHPVHRIESTSSSKSA